MPGGKTADLRIYCICGQKMKVSEAMYGRPGKCVACRQKIRIPRPDEIPSGLTEIHLKDHPQFLRKVKRPKPDAVEETPLEEERVLPAEEGTEKVSTVPLEVLDSLRILCSLEHKMKRQAEALEVRRVDAGFASGTAGSQAELQGQLTRIRLARADLDEELRQRLMEVAIELASTQEKIAEAQLAVRVGETAFFTYQESVEKLRKRRDSLEHRQQNLRGWLAVRDPHAAGGYVDLTMEHLPKEGTKVTFPPEPDGGLSLLDSHLESLREAFDHRERAERRLREVERMRHPEPIAPLGLEELRADGLADKQRAEAAVVFYRARLEQLKNDYFNDGEALNAQMDLARGRLKVGEIDRNRFDIIEGELLRAKADLAKARDVLTRASSANQALDVPRTKGTFLQRLARPQGGFVIQADAWVVWAAALALFLALLSPIFGDNSSLVSAVLRPGAANGILLGIIALVILVIVLLAGISLVGDRSVRGSVILILWVVGAVITTFLIHECFYRTGAIAAAFREGNTWYYRPGVVSVMLAHLGLLLAAAIALRPVSAFRSGFVVAVPAGLVLAAFISTDAAGLLGPRPVVRALPSTQPGKSPGTYKVDVGLRNAGTRPYVLTLAATRQRNALMGILERQIGNESWQLEKTLEAAVIGREEITSSYELSPGNYRLLLKWWTAGTELATPFEVGPPATAAAAETRTDAGTGLKQATTSAEVTSPATTQTGIGKIVPKVSAELRGLLVSAQGTPRFSIILHLAGSDAKLGSYQIGDLLYDPWQITEYNPEEQTATVSNGIRFVILRRGERATLEP
ncbi:MAG: hypothetical protein HY706_13420 [Candidatus Hydrogenedentes bacterium]|nr:hypothetical protein [Candidatus Hydrogenedentota bacterium]